MTLLSHFKFKQILVHLADKSGSKVVICNESYTTKTCNQCGGLNEVGTKEIFNCDHCGYQDDRDVNAAKNILYSSLTR